MGLRRGACGDLSYDESWALWPKAKELSRLVRSRRRQRTSSARRKRLTAAQRFQRLVEDVVVRVHAGTPTFRLVIAKIISIANRLCRGNVREWWFAGIIRRQPGLAAWCFVFLAVTIGIRASDRQSIPEPVHKTPQQRWLRARGAEAVAKTLATIGHGIQIHTVEAKPLGDGISAHYRSREKAIAFDSKTSFSETELLNAAGHECVHAIFHQAELWPGSAERRQYGLLNESAAYVLGAHIAGRVWSRRGFDGEALTDRLVNDYREACDPSLPTSVHWMIAASYGPDGRSWLTTEEELSWSGHFGSPATVDEMDRICRLNYDPLDAARAIAERYRRIDRGDEEKTSAARGLPPVRTQD
jgi:hypothetical protein